MALTVDQQLHAFWELHVNTRVDRFRILHQEGVEAPLGLDNSIMLEVWLLSNQDWQAVEGDALVQITNDEPVTPLGIALHELTTHCGSFEEEVLLREGVVPRVTSLSQTERCAEHDLHPSLAAIACCLCALVVCRRLLGQCFP